MQDLFLQQCHNDVTGMLKPHHRPFHEILACGVRLAWSAAVVVDYSLLVPSSHRALPFHQDTSLSSDAGGVRDADAGARRCRTCCSS